MDFGLSEEQELLQDTVRGFVKGECPVTRLREIFDGAAASSPRSGRGSPRSASPGSRCPRRTAAPGLELLELALVAEALGGGAFPGPFLGHALAGLAIARGGSAAQQARWLPRARGGRGDRHGRVRRARRPLAARRLDARSSRAAACAGAKQFVPDAERAAVCRGRHGAAAGSRSSKAARPACA